MPKNILVEVSPVSKATGLPVTLRMSAAWADASGVNVDSLVWLPLVTDGPKRSVTLFAEGAPAEIAISHGNLSFNLHSDFGNLHWSNYIWDGASGRIWIGEMGVAFASYVQIFEGTFGPLRRKRGQAQVALLGPEADLEIQLLAASYAGTGSSEGHAGLKGSLKPWASGSCQNIEPVLIDATNWIYQVHGYGAVEGIDAVYENALDLGTATSNAASYAALAALTMADGTWATCHASGMFRLANEPSGKVTADVRGAKDGSTYVSTVSTIAQHLMKQAGLSTGQIDATSLNAASTAPWGYYAREQIMIGDVVRSAFHEAGCYVFPSSTGVFKAGNWFTPQTATTLTQDRSTVPLVTSHEQLEAAPPIYRVKIGADRCWSVHTASDISPFLTEAIDQEARDAAAASQTAANAAAANAVAALSRLTNMTSDSVIERAEKAQLVREVARINTEYTGIYSTGTALGITTETAAYATAKSDLTTYIAAISPSYSDLTQDSTVVAATFNTRFSDYYSARQSLLNKIATQGAVAGYLTNESHTVAAASNGTIVTGELANAGGTFKVLLGLSDVTTSSTFSVVAEVGVDVSINSTTGVFTVDSMSADAGIATFRATYGTTSIDKVYTVTKAKAGVDGLSPKTLTVTADRQTIVYTSAGVADPSTQTTTLTATKQNTTGTVTWSVKDSLGTSKTPTTTYLSAATGDSVTMTESQFAAARGSTSGVIITGSITDGTTFTDRVSVVRVANGSAGTDGTNGTSPIVAFITNEAHSVSADASGTVASFADAGGQMRVFEGTTERTASSTFSVVSETGVDVSINSTTGVYTVASMSADTGTATFRAVYSGNTRDVVYSISKSRTGTPGTAGQNAVAGYLTNEAMTLAADSSGAVSSFTGCGGTFKVFYGSSDVTTSSTFSQVSATSGITSSINSTTGVYAVTAMSVDQGSVVYQASYNPGSGAITIQKDFSLSKSRAGTTGTTGTAGTNAKLLTVSSDRQTIAYDGVGAASPTTQTTTFTASKQNTTATVTWSVTDATGTARTPTTTYLSAATGDSVTMTESQFAAARNSTSGVIVTGTLTDGVTLTDRISVTRVAGGASALSVVMSNENFTFAADSSGTVSSYSGGTGTMRVFSGLIEVTGSATFSNIGNSNLTGSINSAGAYTITAMGAVDSGAYIDFQATYGGVDLVKRVSASKARAGTGVSSGGGVRQIWGVTNSTSATEVLTSIVSGSYIEMTADFVGSKLDADSTMYGYLLFEEGTGGTWTEIGRSDATITSDGLYIGSEWTANDVSGFANGFGARSGSVTYRISLQRTSGANLAGSGFSISGTVRVTPPAS